MSFVSAIDLNNKAVGFMHEGKPRDAIRSLRLSLSSIKENYAASEENPSDSSYSQHDETARRISFPEQHQPPLPLAHSPSDSSFNSSFSSFSSDTESQHELHDSMLLEDVKPSISSVPVLNDMISSRQGADDTMLPMFDRALCIAEDEDDRELLTAVVLYNMGLLHHGRGISHGQSTHLSKALQVYQMSLEVIQKNDETPFEPRTNLLILALFNNMAQIYCHILQVDSMQFCLERLRHVLIHGNVHSAVDEDEFTFFFLNAAIYRGEELTIAPAA